MEAYLKENISEIKEDIKEIKQDLNLHMQRTAANETRIEMMEEFVKTQATQQEKVLNIIVDQSEKARTDTMKVIKISLGIFGALATLVTALAAWLN